MADYDYLNARVRGMSTALLSREFFEQLLLSQDESLLIDLLLNSPYEQELRAALTETAGSAAIMAAIRRRIGSVFEKLREIAPQKPRRLIELQLNRWDIANVLAIIRAKVTEATPEAALEATFPVGELAEPQLNELAVERDVAAVGRLLVTWNYTFGFTVREAIADSMGVDQSQLNLRRLANTLNRSYFEWALSQLHEKDPNARILREQLQMQIDLTNVKNAADVVRHREKGHEVELAPFIAGGNLGKRFVVGLADVESLETAFEKLDATTFSVAVERGILAFGETRNLAVMERFLEAVVVEHGCRLFRRNPLTAAVPLGYLWRQYNEFSNLRTLVRGKRFRMPPNAIREELLLV